MHNINDAANQEFQAALKYRPQRHVKEDLFLLFFEPLHLVIESIQRAMQDVDEKLIYKGRYEEDKSGAHVLNHVKIFVPVDLEALTIALTSAVRVVLEVEQLVVEGYLISSEEFETN